MTQIRGEVEINKYHVSHDANGNRQLTLVDTIVHKNTPTIAYLNRWFETNADTVNAHTIVLSGKGYQDSLKDFGVMGFTGVLTDVVVTNGGSGYGSPPTVSISGASATANISGGAVTSVTITNPGSGFTTVPTVTFSGSGGASATAMISYTPGSDVPGGHASDREFVVIDDSTVRYSRVQNFDTPATTRLIDHVGLRDADGRVMAYTVLASTCTQTISDFLQVFYRVFVVEDPDTVMSTSLKGNAQYIHRAFDPKIISGYTITGGTLAYYTSYASNQLQLTATTVEIGHKYNCLGNGFGTGSTTNSTTRYYQDIGTSANVKFDIVQGTDYPNFGSIIAGVGGWCSTTGGFQPQYFHPGKRITYSPIQNHPLVQNTVAHGPSAVGPFKDTGNLPTSKGTMSFAEGSYTHVHPQLYVLKFTSTGSTTTPVTFTVNTGTDKIVATNTVANNERVVLTTTNTLPAPFTTATFYYVVNRTGSDFQLATSQGGAAIDITTSGTGTHSYSYDNVAQYQVYTKNQTAYDWNTTSLNNKWSGSPTLLPISTLDTQTMLTVPAYPLSQTFGHAYHGFTNASSEDAEFFKLSAYEVVAFDATGIAVVDVRQHSFSMSNLDANTTPALSVTAIKQIAVDQVNRYVYIAAGTDGMKRATLASPITGTHVVTNITGPSGAGIDGTKCYACWYDEPSSFNSSVGTLWGVFEGCIAHSTNDGTSWTNHVPANTITGFNNTAGNWANIQQMIYDPYSSAQRMAFMINNIGIVWYTVSASSPLSGNSLLTAMAAGGFTLNGSFNSFNINVLYGRSLGHTTRMKFNNASNLYCIFYTVGGTSATRAQARLAWGATSVTDGNNTTIYGSTHTLYSFLFEDNGSGTLLPIARNSTNLAQYCILNTNATYGNAVLERGMVEVQNDHSSRMGERFALVDSVAIKLDKGLYFYYHDGFTSSGGNGIVSGFYLISPCLNSLFSVNNLFYNLKQFGWTGSAWVENDTGSKPVHSSAAALPGGITVAFTDTQNANNYILNEFYSTHLVKGVMKDEITILTVDIPVFKSGMKSSTDFSSGTVPAAEGSVSNESIAWINFSPVSSTSAVRGDSVYATKRGSAASTLPAMTWSDQRFDSGDFEVTMTMSRVWMNTNHTYRIGLVPDSELVSITDTTIAASELAKYQNTSANFDYAYRVTGLTTSTASSVALGYIEAGTVAASQTVQPYGTDGYGDAVRIRLTRSGTTLTWYVDTGAGFVSVRTASISGSTAYRLVMSNNNTSGTAPFSFLKNMTATYQSTRRMLKFGSSGNSTGVYDDLYYRMPTQLPNTKNFYSFVLNGSPVTNSTNLILDSLTAPASGQITVAAGMGKLWFNSANAGHTLTGSYSYLVTPE